jgi:large subunit ribosomal protein L15
MLHKRKKSGRYRASKTHGWGSMKKRRGKGNKGGAGNAGSFKRGDQKRPSFWKETPGKHGFKPKNKIKDKIITIYDVQKFIENGILKEENGVYDLSNFGFDKLLSKGNVKKAIKIKISKASAKAIEVIKKAGGDVISDLKEEEKQE